MKIDWDLKILTLAVAVVAVSLAYSGILLFPARPVATSVVTVSFILAFLGGALALLSPCSAFVLPAFFSYSFTDKKELLKMTYVFFLGLLTVFIPLGFSASVVSFLFSVYRQQLFIISGISLILLGIVKFFDLQLFSVGYSEGNPKASSTLQVFIIGMFYSFTTISCTGPILGGILTMASANGFSSIIAILLLTVFGLGLVLPLIILSLLFRRFDFRKYLKPRYLDFAGLKVMLHPVNIITGLVLIILGVVFLFYEKINFLQGTTNIYLKITSLLYGSIPDYFNYMVLAAILFFSSAMIMKKRSKNG